MPDSLADRLNRRSEQQRQKEHSQADAIEFQNRVNAYISDNARPEYDRMMSRLKERVDEVNSSLSDLPIFQFQGQMVQQGNCIASWYFEKPIFNAPNNRLTVGIGTHPHAMYFMTERPDPERFYFHAAAADTLDGIVWVGDLGEFTSEALIDFGLERLTEYYLINKPS
jgi:hypothetical protein